jgi:tetratricopeptide (TPR) repeat protein
LGTAYQNRGRYADAEPLFKRSIAIVEKTFGDEQVAPLLNNLALLYANQGRYADAELSTSDHWQSTKKCSEKRVCRLRRR